MSVTHGIHTYYEFADTELPAGSTLSGPRIVTMLKANGSIEKVFSIDLGVTLLGSFSLRYYDRPTGMFLAQSESGRFVIHPEHQEHFYTLSNQVAIHETTFALSGEPGADGSVDPPGVYQMVELTNGGGAPVDIVCYAFSMLRGDTAQDVMTEYDDALHAIVAWNKSEPSYARVVGGSERPQCYEVTLDYGMAVSQSRPDALANRVGGAHVEPLGVLEYALHLDPGKTRKISFLMSVGNGGENARANYKACPPAPQALERTIAYYRDRIGRSIVYTPDIQVNRGVYWSKANMLRVQSKAPTGWCFTNDPTRSNNSVGRDTAWFGFGADYFTPEFVRDSLLAYVRLQEKDGEIIEYYDIRTDKTEDYNLNINDNTPLIIMALWHHYNVTGDVEFLSKVYPAAARAARYILKQRNKQGLVWCTADGTADWGIVGWRNVIPNYRLSGATTEINSECYSALETASHMARVLGKHDESESFLKGSQELKEAINAHLYNDGNGLYYLNIDLDGRARSDVTSDLVFPVIFGVASERTGAAIISRLSNDDFWTEAGMRTVPRDAPNYTPNLGWGLLGGVWVAVSFWYAFAAAKHSPALMAQALSSSFKNYSVDPKGKNTVPGQFSEWLNGETLVNQGMMLSPWFPPRYLWAAIEGMAGLILADGGASVEPRLAPDWKWMAVRNVPYRGRSLTWFVARTPDTRIYTNFQFPGDEREYVGYQDDISECVRTTGDSMCSLGLRQGQNLLLFVGNTSGRTETTSVAVHDSLAGKYQLRTFDSLLGEWAETPELLTPDDLGRGVMIHVERQGFCLLDLRQEI